MWMKSGQERECDKFYRAAMELLTRAKIPFLVGGAYAFGVYTGIERDTKDFDLFLRPNDVDLALEALRRGGYEPQKTFAHWLAKVFCGEHCIDLIYRAGNGLCEVDESWFAHAKPERMLGLEVKLCAPEEIIWMKAFIMERERFDGADVIHLIESCAEKIDWAHVVRRFSENWRVLLAHLVLFGYAFPGERARVPREVMRELVSRLRADDDVDLAKVCRGTLLSRQQYLRDVVDRGFHDVRLEHMSRDEIARWTEAIARDGAPER